MNRPDALCFLTQGFLIPLVSLMFTDRAVAHQYDEEVLYEISATVLDRRGHTFDVLWYYRLDAESWEGEGMMKILGKDYLRLDLPFMNVLIQKSVMSVKYPEEDQVLIDYFNRRDPSNLFAVLLSEFDGFIVEDIETSGNNISLSLVPETLVGFDRLSLTVKENEWIPRTIQALSGEEMEVKVTVLSVHPLDDPEDLKTAELEAAEIIDLRQ